MRPTFKALCGATLVVILCGAESAPGQSLGFESLDATRVGSAQGVLTTTSAAPDFSTSQIELPSEIEAGITISENFVTTTHGDFVTNDCSPGDLAAHASHASLAAFAGFFQEDGDVNCERITLFDRLAEIGAKPFIVAAAAGTVTIAALAFLSNDDTSAGRVSVEPSPTPIPEPTTLLLFMLSVAVVLGWARRRKSHVG